jgi:hypothetical protein
MVNDDYTTSPLNTILSMSGDLSQLQAEGLYIEYVCMYIYIYSIEFEENCDR